MKLLEDRTAVITGAAQGIGFAIATLFAEHGASLVLADLNSEGATSAAETMHDLGVRAVPVTADVRDAAAVKRTIETAVSEFGSLDVLINNAGITKDATLRTMSLEDFELVVAVHLRGAFLGTQAASLIMREQKRGSIINMSSISGKVGMIGQANYSAAKAGIVGLTKAAAKELAHHGVRVNAIQPGLIRTPMTESLRPDVWAQKMAEIPMGRPGDPAEVAGVALFLASDLSSYMTGTVLEVTGGRFM